MPNSTGRNGKRKVSSNSRNYDVWRQPSNISDRQMEEFFTEIIVMDEALYDQ